MSDKERTLNNSIRVLFTSHKITEFYTYRSALVHDFIVEDDKSYSVWKKVSRLVEQNGFSMDNHICFTTENGQHFMWSDQHLVIGKLTVRNW